MLCYKDKTFCGSKNCKNNCGRQFTEEDKIGAELWGGPDAPIAFAYFCDEKGELIHE